MVDHVAVFRDLLAQVGGADLSMTDLQARWWIDQGAARATEALTLAGLPVATDEPSRRVTNLIVSVMLNTVQEEIDAPCPPEALRSLLLTFWWVLPWHQATEWRDEG